MNISEKAQYILANTNNGRDLNEHDLQLVKYADQLTPLGKMKFGMLYVKVKKGYLKGDADL